MFRTFTANALEILMEENLPVSELPKLQDKCRKENWENLLSADQIVAQFSSEEISELLMMLDESNLTYLKEYEPGVFSSEISEKEEVICTDISLYRGRVEDIACSCELGEDGIVCQHVRMLLYYIAQAKHGKSLNNSTGI